MTSITEYTGMTVGQRKVRTDGRAFGLAACLAPITLAASGVIGLEVGLLIAAITAVTSLPGYILLGLPAAYIAITRYPLSDGTLSYGAMFVASLIAVVAMIPVGALLFIAFGASPPMEALKAVGSYALIGIFIGPIEALIFAAWYRFFARPPVPVHDPAIFA